MTDHNVVEELEDEIERLNDALLELNTKTHNIDIQYEESIELYQNIRDASMEMIMLLDDQYCIIDINKKGVDFFGYTQASELFGKSITKFMVAENFEVFKYMLDDDNFEPIELEVFTATYKSIFVLFNSTKFKKSYDTDAHYIINFIDLTDIKKREEYLQKQSLYAQMGIMMDEIAHQWKQPLGIIASISGGIGIKKEMDLKLNDYDIEQCVSIVDEQIVHLTETINDFRDFFRDKRYNKATNIYDTILLVEELLKFTINKNLVDIKINCPKDLTLDMISIEFKHIFINMINNSIDAFNEKMVQVRLITIDIQEKENSIIIIYEDNADGIPDSIMETIFDFNTTTKTKGTGVGLYMAKQIIEKNNGTIKVVNIKDGVKFTIEFSKK